MNQMRRSREILPRLVVEAMASDSLEAVQVNRPYQTSMHKQVGVIDPIAQGGAGGREGRKA